MTAETTQTNKEKHITICHQDRVLSLLFFTPLSFSLILTLSLFLSSSFSSLGLLNTCSFIRPYSSESRLKDALGRWCLPLDDMKDRGWIPEVLNLLRSYAGCLAVAHVLALVIPFLLFFLKFASLYEPPLYAFFVPLYFVVGLSLLYPCRPSDRRCCEPALVAIAWVFIAQFFIVFLLAHLKLSGYGTSSSSSSSSSSSTRSISLSLASRNSCSCTFVGDIYSSFVVFAVKSVTVSDESLIFLSCSRAMSMFFHDGLLPSLRLFRRIAIRVKIF